MTGKVSGPLFGATAALVTAERASSRLRRIESVDLPGSNTMEDGHEALCRPAVVIRADGRLKFCHFRGECWTPVSLPSPVLPKLTPTREFSLGYAATRLRRRCLSPSDSRRTCGQASPRSWRVASSPPSVTSALQGATEAGELLPAQSVRATIRARAGSTWAGQQTRRPHARASDLLRRRRQFSSEPTAAARKRKHSGWSDAFARSITGRMR